MTRDNPFSDAPRLLVIDHTRIADGTATGELKASILRGWPQERLAQIYQRSARFGGFVHAGRETPVQFRENGVTASLIRALDRFDPELIVYRPAPLPYGAELHFHAMAVLERGVAPFAVWLMDDWPGAVAESPSLFFRTLAEDWMRLVEAANWRLSIGEQMSRTLEARHGVAFEPFANGVDPDDWPVRETQSEGPVRFRYAGSLSKTMSMDALTTVAKSIERAAMDGRDAIFEINTRPMWRDEAKAAFAGLQRTRLTTESYSPEDYRRWLSEADVNVLAYNFDAASLSYVRHSIANKLPECLASGAALFAVAPPETATMAFLDERDLALRVKTGEATQIDDAVTRLIDSPRLRQSLGDAGRRCAIADFNIKEIRRRFASGAISTAQEPVGERRLLLRDYGEERREAAALLHFAALNGLEPGGTGLAFAEFDRAAFKPPPVSPLRFAAETAHARWPTLYNSAARLKRALTGGGEAPD